MQTLKLAGFFACAAALLAACGGGSSGGGNPIPIPSGGGTTYSAKIRFVSSMAGAQQIQADLRSIDASSSTPVMVLAPVPCTPQPGDSCYGTTSTGAVQAIVSPMPSSVPAVSFSVNDPNVVLQPTPTPAPGTTPVPQASGVVGVAFANSNGTPNVQSSGTATASIGTPVNQIASTPVYEYNAIALQCIPNDGYEPGWQWNGTSWAPVADPSQADVYVTGSRCSGAYAVSGDDGTLHVPGGATVLSTDTPFYSLLATQWANTATTFAFSALDTLNGDGSFNAIVIGKTRDGSHVFKLFPNFIEYSPGLGIFSGAVEMAGSSVDGF